MLREKISRKLAQLVPHKTIKMNNTRSMVSFTFDDFPKSAAKTGASILEKYGYRGTFYGCGGLFDLVHDGNHIVTEADIRSICQNGHEIGCHTYAHIDCQKAPQTVLAADLQKNAQYIEDITGEAVSSFAYPFGKLDISSRKSVAEQYDTARTVFPGLNTGTVCLHSLRSYSVYSSNFNLDYFTQIIAQAVAENAWLIFYTHDVSETPEKFGCTPKEFESLVACVAQYNIKVKTVRDATVAI